MKICVLGGNWSIKTWPAIPRHSLARTGGGVFLSWSCYCMGKRDGGGRQLERNKFSASDTMARPKEA